MERHPHATPAQPAELEHYRAMRSWHRVRVSRARVCAHTILYTVSPNGRINARTTHTHARVRFGPRRLATLATFSRDPRVAVARAFSVALFAASLSCSMGARTCVHKQTCCYRSSPGVISLTHRAPIFIGEVIHEASSSSLPLLPLPRAHHALSRGIRERTSSLLFPSVLPTLELSAA